MKGRQLGLALKDAGMELAASNGEEWLSKARAAANHLPGSQITTDDVLGLVGMPPTGVSLNVIGCIFKGQPWERVGFATSTRPSAHGRIIATWRKRA